MQTILATAMKRYYCRENCGILMKRAVYLICFLLMLATPMPSSAQITGAEVNLTCPETVEVDDPVSMDTTTYQCTVSNPTSYEENISLEVDGNIIRIGVREDEGVTEESESPDKKWHRSERREFHSFQSRALRMPENTDFSKIESKYENGTLQIDVKKQPTPKHPEPKKISIK